MEALTILPNPEMATVRFRAGSTYTIEELAELARRGIEESGLTQQQVADLLNEEDQALRGTIRRTQISMALNSPEDNAGMLIRLVERFTTYRATQQTRYLLEKK
jgi:hypothetical protein